MTRLRLGIVGCGEVARYKHAPALAQLPQWQVVAVADLDPVRATEVAAALGGGAAVQRDVDALLAAGGLDAVAVLTPPGQHAEVAHAVLGRGLPLLCEKPLCLDRAAAAGLVAAVASAGVPALMGFHMRWHRLVARARRLLASEALGRVESVRSLWASPRGDALLPSWRARRSWGGGALVEIGSHHFDLWRHLLAVEVDEVFCTAGQGAREDESAAVLARLAGGVSAVGAFSERAPHAIELQVDGSAGRLHVDALRFDGFTVQPAAGAPGDVAARLRQLRTTLRELPSGLAEQRQGGDYKASYREMWRHFAECVARGQAPAATFEDGLRALDIALAAAASAQGGRPVRSSDAPPTLLAAR